MRLLGCLTRPQCPAHPCSGWRYTTRRTDMADFLLCFSPSPQFFGQLRADLTCGENRLVPVRIESAPARLALEISKLPRQSKLRSRLLDAVLLIVHPVTGVRAHL